MIKTNLIIKRILIILLIIQIVLWACTKKEVLQFDLPLRLFAHFVFISLIFWLQVVALIKYPSRMDHMDKFLHPYRPNLIKDVRKRQKVAVIIGLVIIVIMFINYIVLIVSYIGTHFIWIMNHFAKITRIFGLVTLLGCISIVVWSAYEGKKTSEKVIYKDIISTIGLLIENIKISMVLIIS